MLCCLRACRFYGHGNFRFEDFSFPESSTSFNTPDPVVSVAATSQESGHAEPAPIEPVEIDLGNAPMPYDMDAPQSIT